MINRTKRMWIALASKRTYSPSIAFMWNVHKFVIHNMPSGMRSKFLQDFDNGQTIPISQQMNRIHTQIDPPRTTNQTNFDTISVIFFSLFFLSLFRWWKQHTFNPPSRNWFKTQSNPIIPIHACAHNKSLYARWWFATTRACCVCVRVRTRICQSELDPLKSKPISAYHVHMNL